MNTDTGSYEVDEADVRSRQTKLRERFAPEQLELVVLQLSGEVPEIRLL